MEKARRCKFVALFKVKKKLSFEDDIINSCLLRGSGFVDGKKRIVELFNNSELSNKQRAKLICKEYGIGGWGSPLSGDGLHGADHDSKGLKISYRKDGEDKEMLLKWEDVERRIKTLIDENLYIG